MKTYLQSAPGAQRDLDISRWIWDSWERQAIKAWLQSSRSRRQCLKRMEVAIHIYKTTLWWAVCRALVPNQQLAGLEPGSFDTEEFCWEGIVPTPEAERQLLELAAQQGHDWIERCDDSELLREQLMQCWTVKRPVGSNNRYLFADHLLGEGADELSYR
jgi:hypothetical protein